MAVWRLEMNCVILSMKMFCWGDIGTYSESIGWVQSMINCGSRFYLCSIKVWTCTCMDTVCGNDKVQMLLLVQPFIFTLWGVCGLNIVHCFGGWKSFLSKTSTCMDGISVSTNIDNLTISTFGWVSSLLVDSLSLNICCASPVWFPAQSNSVLRDTHFIVLPFPTWFSKDHFSFQTLMSLFSPEGTGCHLLNYWFLSTSFLSICS